MEGWVSKDAFADPCYAGCSFGKQMRPLLADQKATLVIGDKAVPMSTVVELYKAINNGAWERIDGALRVNAVTQEHITQCFKDIGIELEPPF